MAIVNLNTGKISEASRGSSESKSSSGESFFNVFVWVFLGALFATGVVGVDIWQNRDKGSAPAAQKEAPAALSFEQK